MLTFREGLAEAYELRGDWAEAERLHRLLVSRRRKVVGHDRSRLGDDLVALGRNLLMRSRWQEAESLLRESLQIDRTATIDRWRHYLALSQLGGSLLGQGRYVDAEPLIVQGYEGMKAREAKIPAPDKPRLSSRRPSGWSDSTRRGANPPRRTSGSKSSVWPTCPTTCSQRHAGKNERQTATQVHLLVQLAGVDPALPPVMAFP